MDQLWTVLTTSIEFKGETYSASFYERDDGLIHAQILDETHLIPKGQSAADAVVRSLMTIALTKRHAKLMVSENSSRRLSAVLENRPDRD